MRGKADWMPVFCIAGSVILYLMLNWFVPERDPVAEQGYIIRGNYGEQEREYELLVKGLAEEEIPIRISVGSKIYTEAEAEAVFAEILESMEERIRGDNVSLMEVNRDLKLPARLNEAGVRIRWYPSDTGMMDSSGKLLQEVEKPFNMSLSAELITEVLPEGKGEKPIICHRTYQIPICLVPVQRDESERLIEEYRRVLAEEEERQKGMDRLQLPLEFGGYSLSYRSRDQSGYESLLLLGILAAGLVWVRNRNAGKEQEKKRERELLLDYAELLSKMTVLTGAGLTVRNAWGRMTQDYEQAKMSGRQKPRAAYEEMSRTCSRLRNGMSEGEAYKEFGRRCKLPSYLKLAGLLEQNCRSGTKNLREIFRTEMEDALEQRKNLARRLGEEAGTKLLVPLFLLLGVVMIMIMVPAMMTLG